MVWWVGESRAKPPRVLIVDDQPEMRELLADLLDLQGYDPALARDGIEATRLARELQPAAITLDLCMPGRDGQEVLYDLAGDDRTRSIPVVVVSASGQDLITTPQVSGIVCKPFEVSDLLAAVDDAVRFDGPRLRRAADRARPRAL